MNIYKVKYYYTARCGKDQSSSINDVQAVRVVAPSFQVAIRKARKHAAEINSFAEEDENGIKTGRMYRLTDFDVDSVTREEGSEVIV